MTVLAPRIEPVVRDLPPGFAKMRAEASSEGYRFLERLATAWESGIIRFDRDGESLLAAYSAGVLAGIGGLTVEPVIPCALRMRRFYVRAPFRRTGIGRMLAIALLDWPRLNGVPVTVNAAVGSGRFWESLGFSPDPSNGYTHILLPGH